MLLFPPLRSILYPSLRSPVITLTHYFSHHAASQQASTAIERLKRPSRGGQNLSDRYRRLEKSLRVKEAFSGGIDDTTERTTVLVHGAKPRLSHAKTFKGFRIPEEPKPPEPDGMLPNFPSCNLLITIVYMPECCMSGCAICIHDLYQESLTAYKESIDSLRTSLSTLEVPESEWPPNVQTSAEHVEWNRNVALSAFEEMERRLKEKHERKVPADFGC
jgi:hypothetical protein